MRTKRTKSFEIPKKLVHEAYLKVKANKGAAGIDGESMRDFEKQLKDNLYIIWNRMSSGSYVPPPIKAVKIPKGKGKTRMLGIPTVSDRIAQMVVKLHLEPKIDPSFHKDSYGYRPGKSAHQALAATRQRCWRMDWVIDLDIKEVFDNLDHDLIMEALKRHTDQKWVMLYIKRWLKAPMIDSQGQKMERSKGTSQGGVISPLIANLFMHYAFDRWMELKSPS